MLTLYPNAKINIGLAVVRRRPDGYHDLQSVFMPVPGLHDELSVEVVSDPQAPDYTFIQEGIAVDCPPESNLIIRTYLMMRERYPEVGKVAIRFRKQIPFGAGLGGGSADAAFMLRAINELFHLSLTDAEMEQLIAPLGADCAFFIQNRPRYATGIGNIFSEVSSSLLDSLQGKYLLLVKPQCAVSTAQAYRGILTREAQGIAAPGPDAPLQALVNDFEQTVFPLFPEIADIKQQLLDMGAEYAAMSGSGATCFGIFTHPVADTSMFSHCFSHQEQMMHTK